MAGGWFHNVVPSASGKGEGEGESLSSGEVR